MPLHNSLPTQRIIFQSQHTHPSISCLVSPEDDVPTPAKPRPKVEPVSKPAPPAAGTQHSVCVSGLFIVWIRA